MLSLEKVREEIGDPVKFDSDCATYTYYVEGNGVEWRVSNKPDEDGEYEFAARTAGAEDWHTQGYVKA